MSVRQKKQQAGFTIVELLIVIAIAGFIMLLVFMALPALQRNGRNSQRKQDIAVILSAVSRYELNHGGSFPVCSGAACTTAGNFLRDAKMSYYSAANVTATALAPLQTAAVPAGQDDVYVYNHYKCEVDPATGAVSANSAGAGYHDIVALYNTESSGGSPVFQCRGL